MTGPSSDEGIGLPARVMAAAIAGGVAFWFGDASYGAIGWAAVGVTLVGAAAVGWAWRSRWPILGYAAGGMVGTWLSVLVQWGSGATVTMADELLKSGVMAVLSLVAAGLAAASRSRSG